MEDRLTKWLANYKGETPESKAVMARTKDTYKGDAYLPWANMVGILYRLDPYATIEKVMNKDGGYVFSDIIHIETKAVNSKDGKSEEKYNYQTAISHVVKVRVTYYDKVFEEVYPIQDNAYGAVAKYDSNMVNKALQRCMARTISLATGIGWSLYEQGEAGQFEDDGTLPKQTPVVEETVASVDDMNDGRAFTVAEQVANLLITNRENTALSTLIDNYNTVLAKKYKFNDEPLTIDLANDSMETIVEKFKDVENIDKIWKGVSKVVK